MPARAFAQAASASLRRHFLWLLLGVSGMLVGGVALSLWFSLQVDERSQQRLLQRDADMARASLVRRLDYYRALIGNIASDPALEDLIRFNDTAAQQQWAESRQRLIPDLLGLALITPEGEVLGGATSLGMGPAFRADVLHRGVRREGTPRFHRSPSGAEHIDLASAVRGEDGKMQGGVFLSVRLSQLQRIVDESTHPGHALTLLDATGGTIASKGDVTGAAREIRLVVPTTGWTIVARAPMQKLAHSGKVQIVAGLLTLGAVLLVLVGGMLRLRRIMLRDVDATLDALTALARDEPVPAIVPHYAEFEPAVADINLIALHLQEQRTRLEHLSLSDPLTGLPNRRAFETRFPQAQGFADRGHHIALVLIDIDYFKRINDTHGHGVGDQVLLALAQTLKALTRRADLAARLAGDEFAILLSDLDAAGVALWYQRLSDHFSGELNALGLNLQTGLSAGQTWLEGVTRDSMNQALARADRVLYQAKERGRGQLVFDAPAGEQDAG